MAVAARRGRDGTSGSDATVVANRASPTLPRSGGIRVDVVTRRMGCDPGGGFCNV